MPEHVVTYPPGSLAEFVKDGRWAVTTTPTIETQLEVDDPKAEKARNIFGEDFFGKEAIHTFEEKCRAKGIAVSFEIPRVPMHLDERQLKAAKAEEAEGKERMVTLRPEWMVVNGERKPVNILTLRDLFEQETTRPDPKKPGQTETVVTYDNNPFGDGPVFRGIRGGIEGDNFAHEQMKPGYGLPTKEAIPDSWDKTWNDQQQLFGKGEKRREAVETVWDSLIYYAVTGEKVLADRWELTNSQTSDGLNRVVVRWLSAGLTVHYWHPGVPLSDIGVCSSL